MSPEIVQMATEIEHSRPRFSTDNHETVVFRCSLSVFSVIDFAQILQSRASLTRPTTRQVELLIERLNHRCGSSIIIEDMINCQADNS